MGDVAAPPSRPIGPPRNASDALVLAPAISATDGLGGERVAPEEDVVYYVDKQGVRVTNRVAIFGSTKILVSTIVSASVEEQRPDATSALGVTIGAAASMVAGSIGFLMSLDIALEGFRTAGIAASIFLIGSGVVAVAWGMRRYGHRQRKYLLRVVSRDAESVPIQSFDRKYVELIAAMLLKASSER